MANILVKETQIVVTVWPAPQNIAWSEVICKLEDRYTKAMAAELNAPHVAGVTIPIIIKNNGKNLRQK